MESFKDPVMDSLLFAVLNLQARNMWALRMKIAHFLWKIESLKMLQHPLRPLHPLSGNQKRRWNSGIMLSTIKNPEISCHTISQSYQIFQSINHISIKYWTCFIHWTSNASKFTNTFQFYILSSPFRPCISSKSVDQPQLGSNRKQPFGCTKTSM